MKKGQIVAVAVLAIATTAAYAQIGAEVALSGAGVFTKTTSSSTSNISNTPTKSMAVFGTIGYHLTKHHAFEITLGHTNNSQIFTVPPDTYRVMTGVFEYTGAYVFTPSPKGRWQPFVLAGAGGLKFSVGTTYINTFQTRLGAKGQTRPAVVYGAGADYRIFEHLGLRLQYRGLIFRSPDFSVPSRFYTGAIGHMAEPSIGIVAKF